MEKEAKCMFVLVKEIPSTTITGFHRVAAEMCILLGYYAASSGNFHCSLRNNPEERSYQNASLQKCSVMITIYACHETFQNYNICTGNVTTCCIT
jgi:hypothetical protein